MLLVGCLGRGSSEKTRQNTTGGQNDTAEQDETEKPTAGLQFSTVCADEVERNYISYEYITVENAAETPQNVSGYTVQYGSSETYQITDLTLEPGARLTIRSRSGDDTVLQSYPPVYIRHAGFGEGINTSVLAENGTVSLRDPAGTTVAQYNYENYGCQGE